MVKNPVDLLIARVTKNEQEIEKLKQAIIALHDYSMLIFDRLAEDLPGVPMPPEKFEVKDDGKVVDVLTVPVTKKYPKTHDDPNHDQCEALIHSLK